MNLDRKQELEALYQAVRRCTHCQLHIGRTNAVPGDGPVDAEIMFIGEGPGFHEDQQGIPFVGQAGKLLSELLEQVGIARQRVYITNVVKCRPPGNRDPLPEEIEACRSYLDRQIELIHPQIVVTLGRYSMARAFPTEKISAVHGQPRKVGDFIYFPMYHPAAALHQPSLRPAVEEDFSKLRELLEGQMQAHEYTPPPEAEQLSLF